MSEISSVLNSAMNSPGKNKLSYARPRSADDIPPSKTMAAVLSTPSLLTIIIMMIHQSHLLESLKFFGRLEHNSFLPLTCVALVCGVVSMFIYNEPGTDDRKFWYIRTCLIVNAIFAACLFLTMHQS